MQRPVRRCGGTQAPPLRADEPKDSISPLSSFADFTSEKMNHWSLKTKLLGTVGAVLLLLAATSFLAIWAANRQRASADTALGRLADALEARDVIVSALRTYQNQADTIINLQSDGADFTKNVAALETAIRRFTELADTAEEKAWGTEMLAAESGFSANYQQEVLPRVRKYLASSDPAEKSRLLEEIRSADGKSDGSLKVITENAEKGISSLVTESTRAKAAYQTISGNTQTLLLTLLGGAILLGTVLGYFVASGIAKSLTAIAADLSAGASQSSAAATQVSSSSQSLAEGSNEQAASLEETSSSLEEMASMTKRNADSAEQANALAKQARAAADIGAGDMQAMRSAMADIKVSSDDIAKIIKTIDEIAFQTNILALNAAVEAARAGEAGAGFAVVAEEVRSLAQRSAVAAKDSAGKIEAAIAKTANGVQITDKVAQSLHEIVDKARKVDELVAEIAHASKEQSQGIAQVNTAVSQMDKVTQSNAANAEESASAAEELNAQAAVLKELVEHLRALTHGRQGASNSRREVEIPSMRTPSAGVTKPRSSRPSNAAAPALSVPR